MRVTRILTTSVTAAALAFSMLASTIPANAASNPGFHAAWVVQSAYANAAPGQTVQMSAVYQNTGDNPWNKGQLGTSQANFATAAPRDNTTLSAAGWSAGQNWLSANRFAAQATDLVAPGQLGSFVWSVKVPSTQAAGVTAVYGIPVIDGQTFMEDYGFFLNVTVTAGTVSTDSTSPASPANNATPAVNGSGAPAGATVTLYDGSTTIGTATASSTGGWSITSSALTEGAHVFSATATDSTSAFFASKNTLTYAYDKTKPTASAVTQQDAQRLIVTFSEAVTNASAINAVNYVLNTACGVGNALAGATLTQSTDKLSVTILETFAGRAVSPCGGTITISGLIDLAGNIQTTVATYGFTFNDTTAPTITSVTATAAAAGTTTAATVAWSEAVNSPALGTYSIDTIVATSTISGTNPSKVNLTAISPAMAAGSTHSLCVTGEKDASANAQATSPLCVSFTVSTTSASTPFAISSFAQGSTDTAINVVWNRDIGGGLGTWTAQYNSNATAVAAAITPAADATNTAQTDLTFATVGPWAGASPCDPAGTALATTCAITVTVTGATDLAGPVTQIPATQSFIITLTLDTVKPTIINLTANTPLTNGMTNIDVKWSKPVTAPTAANISVANAATTGSCSAANVTPCVGGVAVSGLTVTVVSSTLTRLTLITPGAYSAGSYTVAITAGTASDLSAVPLANAAFSGTVTVLDATPPAAPALAGDATGTCAVGGNTVCKTFTFTFGEKMNASASIGVGSITDVSNYLLDGAALPAGAFITSNVAQLVSTLTLAANVSVGGHNFVVQNVKDKAGNVISPNPTGNLGFTRVP